MCGPARAASAVHVLRDTPVAAFPCATTPPACVHPPCHSCCPPLIRHCAADCIPGLAARVASAGRTARRPGAFFPGDMQFALQSVHELQNAAGFGFHDRLHHLMAPCIQHGNHNRFLVHVHSDILNFTTHLSCLLGGKQ